MSILYKKTVVILGLGHHGGGIASARFAVYSKASHILISDIKPKNDLLSSIEKIQDICALPFVDVEFGKHSKEKILSADIVIKNPAIPHHSPIIQMCIANNIRIETDISLYLREVTTQTHCTSAHHIIAITGTKGKSSISTALHRWHEKQGIPSVLAGNITHSPLTMLMNKPHPRNYITVLELSSFQLGDLQLVQKHQPSQSLYTHIRYALLTNILPDHQNYYASIKHYINDKLSLFFKVAAFAHTNPQDTPPYCILPRTSPLPEYAHVLKKLPIYDKLSNTIVWHSDTPLSRDVGIWQEGTTIVFRDTWNGEPRRICTIRDIPKTITVQNALLFIAICIMKALPLPSSRDVWSTLFTIPHRKEYLGIHAHRHFFNDSAATIPQAIDIASFRTEPTQHIHLITGGTDKNLIPDDFMLACREESVHNRATLYILEGSYSEKIIPYLNTEGIPFHGPFSSLEESIYEALRHSTENDVIALSPGCASFGMFAHEFDRGDTFKAFVLKI